MNRRTALRLLALGAGTLVVPLAPGCDDGTSRRSTLGLAPWSGPPPEEHDVRLRALSYAVLAPNAHNTQPWLLGLGDDHVDLFVDETRLLPETDPPYRQAHISQGTFIELLVIALAEHGVASEVRYFPEGEYGGDALEKLPVARVRLLTAPAARDPLFSAITRRTSNKGAYDLGRMLSAADSDALVIAPAREGVHVQVVGDAGKRSRLAEICVEAMAIEVRTAARNAETARWFRFSEAEIEEKRDGFSLLQTGMSGYKRWFVEKFILDRRTASDPDGAFARGAVDQVRGQAHTAAAFGVLTSAGNSRRAQVVAGRAYARVALTATSRGLAMQPLSQALEEYTEMAEVKERLERELGLPTGQTVQMFFRLGYADATRHTPRRDIRELLRPAG